MASISAHSVEGHHWTFSGHQGLNIRVVDWDFSLLITRYWSPEAASAAFVAFVSVDVDLRYVS